MVEEEKIFVVMVDDDDYFLSKWNEILGKEIIFISFKDLTDCEGAFISQREDVLSSKCIIVDFEFGKTNAGKRDFATYLREIHGYKNPILMCSLHDKFGDYDELVRTTYDHILDKMPLTWLELSKVIERIKRKSYKTK
jgi:hypothetical protein